MTPFPKGHVAIATSWSAPDSACALHTRFGDGDNRGPVRFHMDLAADLEKARKTPSTRAQTRRKTSGKTTPRKTAVKKGKTTYIASVVNKRIDSIPNFQKRCAEGSFTWR